MATSVFATKVGVLSPSHTITGPISGNANVGTVSGNLGLLHSSIAEKLSNYISGSDETGPTKYTFTWFGKSYELKTIK